MNTGIHNFSYITGGLAFAQVLEANGTLFSWGKNDYGR
jgi:alpha-tubulin suppressor-like RCC1 family protein